MTGFSAILLMLCMATETPTTAPASGARPGDRLRVAVAQFPVSGDLEANAGWVQRQIRQARDQNADLVLFPETALCGYAGVDLPSLATVDWQALERATHAVCASARRHELFVVLGSMHRLGDGHRPLNCLYLINPEGRIVDRYDKRFLTERDLRHYSPGHRFVTFTLHGVRCGLLICYDVRFPELYRQYALRDVRVMFHAFYNARLGQGSLLLDIVPATLRARAATNGMFVVAANACAPQAWPGRVILPDGRVAAELPVHEPAVRVIELDLTERYYDASGPFRRAAILGTWHNGKLPGDPRAAERQAE